VPAVLSVPVRVVPLNDSGVDEEVRAVADADAVKVPSVEK